MTTFQSGMILCIISLFLSACASGSYLAPDHFATTMDGKLSFLLVNPADGKVEEEDAKIRVFVDEKLQWEKTLEEISESYPALLNAKAKTQVVTDVRLAGSNRRVAVHVDPTNALRDMNRYQKIRTQGMDASRQQVNGIEFNRNYVDLSLYAIYLSDDSHVTVVISNTGNVRASENSVQLAFSIKNEDSGSGQGQSPQTRYVQPLFAGNAEPETIKLPVKLTEPGIYRITVEITVDDISQDADSTNNSLTRRVIFQRNVMDDYLPILNNSKIARNLIFEDKNGVKPYPQWPDSLRQELKEAIERIEKLDEPLLPYAPPVDLGVASSSPPIKSAKAARRLYLSRVAQSLWVERHEAVPWKLADYSDDDLKILLDSRILLNYNETNDHYSINHRGAGAVTDWNPRMNYRLMKNFGFIRSTPWYTILSLTDWMRGRMDHAPGSILGGGTTGDTARLDVWGYAGLPSTEHMVYPHFYRVSFGGVTQVNQRSYAAGCHGASGFYNAMLAAVNIPSRSVVHQTSHHSMTYFPSEGRILRHGDDVYDQSGQTSWHAHPTSEELMSQADHLLRDNVLCTYGDDACIRKKYIEWFKEIIRRTAGNASDFHVGILLEPGGEAARKEALIKQLTQPPWAVLPGRTQTTPLTLDFSEDELSQMFEKIREKANEFVDQFDSLDEAREEMKRRRDRFIDLRQSILGDE